MIMLWIYNEWIYNELEYIMNFRILNFFTVFYHVQYFIAMFYSEVKPTELLLLVCPHNQLRQVYLHG